MHHEPKKLQTKPSFIFFQYLWLLLTDFNNFFTILISNNQRIDPE